MFRKFITGANLLRLIFLTLKFVALNSRLFIILKFETIRHPLLYVSDDTLFILHEFRLMFRVTDQQKIYNFRLVSYSSLTKVSSKERELVWDLIRNGLFII